MATALLAPHSSATPAPAVEVVTSLAGSLVSVDTLTAGAPARRVNLPLVAGAALLAMAATTFGYGLYAAHRDAKARAVWNAEKRPAWAFRPTRHGAGLDVAAGLGSLLGLPLLGLGIAGRRRAERTRFRVGADEAAELPIADARATYTLVDRGDSGFIAAIDGLDGEVAYGGTVTTLAAMRQAGHVAVPIHVGTSLRAEVGHATLFVRGVEAPAPTAAAPMSWQRQPLAYFAASAVAHLGLLGLLAYGEPDSLGAPTDMSLSEQSSSRSMMASIDTPPPPPPEDGDATADGGSTGEASAPTATAVIDGTLGAPTPNPNAGRLRVADRGLSPRMSREAAIAAASEAGILSAMVGPIAVTGGGNIASGFDDMDITGGFYDGDGVGAPTGTWGSGVRGTGTGCGNIAGVPCTGLASDPFATLGRDDGRNYIGTLGDNGPGGPRKRVGHPPKVTFSQPIACSVDEPCLDKEVIRRYIHRNREKIAYCYERELLAKPGLEGTVVANFTLNGNGRVIQSTATGVDPTVASCIAEVISNVSFPKVGGTGIYPIKYPFQLRPRG